MKRPLSDKRPVGPFAQMGSTEGKLMVGFPVQLPQGDMTRTDDPLGEIQEEVARRFNISRGIIKVDDVRLSGFDAPVVKFISFPVADKNETQTARNISTFVDRAETIVEETTGGEFAANVSVWAGSMDSAKNIL